MAEVFISYAREDQEFARDLNTALKNVQRETWIDWRSIPDSAKWRAEIFAAIEAADNFVFIISADSLGSWMCGQEVAHALASKKRIVTILYRQVDYDALVPGLKEIQWITIPRLAWGGLSNGLFEPSTPIWIGCASIDPPRIFAGSCRYAKQSG